MAARGHAVDRACARTAPRANIHRPRFRRFPYPELRHGRPRPAALSVGEVLDRSFALFRRRFGTLVLITLVCTGLPVLLMFRMIGRFADLAETGVTGVEAMAQGLGSLCWSGFLVFVMTAIANAAIVFVISEAYLGRTIGVGTALQRALPMVVRVVLLSFLQQVIFIVVGLVMSIPIGALASGLW